MANYPGALSTNANLYIAVNSLQTTLAATCTSGATTLTLTSTTGFPTTGLVTIDNTEVVSYTGVSGATITGCTRGADGTTAAAHLLGVTVGLTVVAAHHNLLKDEVIAIETALGTNLVNVFPATATTGTGSVVLQTSPTINSPTLTTPALGTPASGILTNATGLPIVAGTTGTLTVARGGTGTTTSTGTVDVVLSTSPTLITPNLGTPSAVTLTNATGIPNSATTATSSATASTIMSRDASINTKVNEMVENFSTTVTAAGTTTLTVTSSPLQQFTGTTTQTVKLPDATTLSVGFYFTVLNRSTGAVTVNNNGSVLQKNVPTATQYIFICTNVGSANGTWDVSSDAGTGTVTSVSGTTNQITSTGGNTPVLAIASPLTLPGAMTAGGAIAMGANKITGLANGTASSDAAAFGQLKVIQIIAGTSTTAFSTTSSSFQTTNLSASITPSSSSNKVLVMVNGQFIIDTSAAAGAVTVARGGTNILATQGFMNPTATAANSFYMASYTYVDAPASTSALTYAVQIKSNGTNTTEFPGTTNSTQSIILMEVVA